MCLFEGQLFGAGEFGVQGAGLDEALGDRRRVTARYAAASGGLFRGRGRGRLAAGGEGEAECAQEQGSEESFGLSHVGALARGLGLAEAVGAGGVGAGGLVDAFDDLLRVGDSGEDEVVVVAGSGVEVDVADLHDPLVDGLVEVDVLDPLEAGLLDLPRDDPALDVEAAVGDRVGRRDALDEADQDRQADDHEDDQEDGPAADVEEPDGGADDDGDQDSLQVEADDRPPRGVALEDHPLSRTEVQRHRAQHTRGVRHRP